MKWSVYRLILALDTRIGLVLDFPSTLLSWELVSFFPFVAHLFLLVQIWSVSLLMVYMYNHFQVLDTSIKF
jgi:hypothetical protein